MDHRDALLEIGCEELPTDYIAPAVRQMKSLAEKKLEEAQLQYAGIEVEATPRRLVLMINGLRTEQPQVSKTVKGPAVGAAQKPDGTLTPAGEGFLRKLGAVRDQVAVADGYWLVTVTEQSRSAQEILPKLFLEVIKGLTFPKTMRWESSGARFARPVRWIVALFGSDLVPLAFADVASGRTTYLHPLHEARTAEVSGTAAYVGVLKQGRVTLATAERVEAIRSALAAEAARLGGRVVDDPESRALLETVAMMAEHPGVVSGAFKSDYLAIPREITVTAMREHQRYFAVEDASGRLLPAFLAIADNPLADPASIRPGCERVLEARLKDAEFFFREDMKRPLADRVPELSRVLWIKGLGNLLDKTRRLERLTAWLASKLDPAREAEAVAAAHLAKADLITNMVQEKEFTSLQGVMGTYYALAQGVAEPVARALREQYQPRNAADACPATPAGRLLALAEKLDQLVGCWGAGFAPTGAKDPYALRRAAQGVVAIALDAGFRFSLREALLQTAAGFPQVAAKAAEVASEAQAFILGRLETELANRQHPPDRIQSLLGVWADDIASVLKRAEVIGALQAEAGFAAATTAFSRVVNILPKGTPRSLPPETPELAVSPAWLDAGAEQELAAGVARVRDELAVLAAAGDFTGYYRRLEGLVPLVNRFFEEVLVMDPNEAKRTNRLGLLTNLARLIWRLADFSRLVGREN